MGAKRKYRWDDWFDCPRTVLVRGQDYQCSQSAMTGQLRNRASERGVRIKLADRGDSIIVEVIGAVHDTNTIAVAE